MGLRGLNHETERVYRYLVTNFEQGKITPTQREIAKACYISRTAVQRHLSILAARGLILWEEHKARSISLPRE